jgi:hypothetical protein
MKINHPSRPFCPSVLAMALEYSLSPPRCLLLEQHKQAHHGSQSSTVATTSFTTPLRSGDVTCGFTVADNFWGRHGASPDGFGVPSLPPPSLPLIQVALDAEQGALVVADPLLPIIPDFYVKTKYSSYAWPMINYSTRTAKSVHR